MNQEQFTLNKAIEAVKQVKEIKGPIADAEYTKLLTRMVPIQKKHSVLEKF